MILNCSERVTSMNKNQINIDYKNAISQADELDKTVEHMQKAMIILKNTLDNLAGSWKGSCADDYRKQGSDVAGLIQNEITYINKISNGIRKTAEIYLNNELQKLAAQDSSK